MSSKILYHTFYNGHISTLRHGNQYLVFVFVFQICIRYYLCDSARGFAIRGRRRRTCCCWFLVVLCFVLFKEPERVNDDEMR